ncbi:MAG: PPC domain-containing DNA-binding protein [Candidatus Limnocylindria bacterium]
MTERTWEASPGRTFVGRLEKGSDLVAEIERICAERGVSAARVSVIGAVRRAAFAMYHQTDHRYLELASETHREIVGFVGNVSLRDGKPFLHAHATFADEHGACVGGHLLRGVEVFVAEFEIRELLDVALIRTLDEEIGLALW